MNAARTQLTATLASNGYSGGLQITQGMSTWYGPFVPVSGTVGTLAGNGYAGFADGQGSVAKLSFPYGICVDASDNVFVADQGNGRIRKITPSGKVSTIAGGGVGTFTNGQGTEASFNGVLAIAADSGGNLFVCDGNNAAIRKITPQGYVSTFAGTGVPGFVDGATSSAQFNWPRGITVDGSGNVYVADANNNRIRQISPAGVVSTLVGQATAGLLDGTGAAAKFNYPCAVTFDGYGLLFVGDGSNNVVRKVTIANAAVSTYAGTGVAGFADGATSSAQFNGVRGVATDNAGNVYVSDCVNNATRKITPTGVVSTIVGSRIAGFLDGPALSSQIFPRYGAIAMDSRGRIYIADEVNNRVRVYTP